MRCSLPLATLACILSSGAAGFAQFRPPEQGIEGSGEIVLKHPAERMRMQIDLLAKSNDLSDALNDLSVLKARATKKLETLGALEDSIKFGSLRLYEPEDENQRDIMMRQRVARRPGQVPSVAQAGRLMVAIRLTAEWPLKSEDGVNQLLEARTLQDAIKAADLAGAKRVNELPREEPKRAEDEAEDDAAEEDMGMMYPTGDGPRPGEPAFLYTARITDADREKCLADAYRHARDDAARLAKAAGVELGTPRSLMADTGTGDKGDEYVQQLYRRGFSQLANPLVQNTSEAIGVWPGMLRYRITIIVTFNVRSRTLARSK